MLMPLHSTLVKVKEFCPYQKRENNNKEFIETPTANF